MVDEYISVTQDVREMVGNIVPARFPDAEIVEEQKAAYSYMATILNKFDWEVSDPEYRALQKLEAQIAKCYIQEHYGGPAYQQSVNEQMKLIKQSLLEIKDNMVEPSAQEGDTITRTEYKSWVLNPEIPYESKLDQSLRADSVGTLD